MAINKLLVSTDPNVVKGLPPTKLLSRKVQNQRRKQHGPTEQRLEDITIPTLLLPNNTLFNLYDNKKPGHRLIILASKRGIKVLSKSKTYLNDGTFRVTPKTLMEKFLQLYVVHGEFRKTGFILGANKSTC